MKRTLDIGIVGAGIAGITAAYELSKRGHAVTIYDREPHAALKCSHANGGQVSVCNSQTWNTWENVFKGLKWALKPDAPLSLGRDLSVAKLKWLAGFLFHTVSGTHHGNTKETIALGLAARARYDEIIEQEGLTQFGQAKTGLLHVYTSDKALEAAAAQESFFNANGLEWTPMSREEVVGLDPALKTFAGLRGGIYTPSDWTGDIRMFCQELLQVCVKKYGVKTVFGKNVSPADITHLWMAHDKVVLSNGHEIAEFAAALGDSMNVYPVKGYSISIPVSGEGAPKVSLLDDEKKIVSSLFDYGDKKVFRVAGTAELAGENYDIRYARVKPLLNWVRSNFPELDTSEYSSWACLRPMNSNMMPIVKRSKHPIFFYHGAHGHLGWTLSAGTAQELVKVMQA